MKRIVGIVPARGGSKGIPRKNLAMVAGKPMVAHTFEEARKSVRLERVVLSTDDEEIAALGRAGGIEVPFRRPAALAADTATVEAVVTHALDWLAEHERYAAEAFVILHPTTPLRTASHIDEAVTLLEQSGADAVVGVSPPMEHPCDMVYFEGRQMRFVLPDHGYGRGLQRQAYPPCYFVNGVVYVTRTDAYRRTGSRFGASTVPYVMDPLDSIDVDGPADLVVAELLLERRQAGLAGTGAQA